MWTLSSRERTIGDEAMMKAVRMALPTWKRGKSSGRVARESLATWSTVAQTKNGLRSATLLTELLALVMLVATVRAPNVRHGAHGAWREAESEKNDLPTRPLSRATRGQWSALALRHTDGARMGVGASNGTSQS